MFGMTVHPAILTDNWGTASLFSADKNLLRSTFTRAGYAASNALVNLESYVSVSSTGGRVLAVLFRIRNTSTSEIAWAPVFQYTANRAWAEIASIALNGTTVWTGDGGAGTQGATGLVRIPGNRTSTVIFVAQGSAVTSTTAGYFHTLALVFTNNSLALPAGLEFVDDLDTATGGWEQ
jgi:hypothetical protein